MLHNKGDVIEELDRSGRVISRYIKGRLLGKGGFAKCYECTEIDTMRLFAAKIIEKKTLSKPKTQQKLKSEIKIHSSLRHQHIVKFEKFFEDAENVYILLEVCSQQTLMELLRRKRRLSEQETAYIMMQTLSGVKYMHEKNIIHRDLKLGNLFLNDNLEIKVGDFGLAAQLEFDGERKLTVCGTPNYIAPEVLEGGRNGHSFEVDIWSLGVIMYTLLVGKPPFETNDIKATYRKIRNTNYTFPDDLTISPAARDLIKRILQSCPESRPTLLDLENDIWFKLIDVPHSAPISLYPPGPQRQIAQDRQLFRDPPKPKPTLADPRIREPLRPINTNLAPEALPTTKSSPRYGGTSPRNVPRTISPRTLTRPASDQFLRPTDREPLRRAQSDREVMAARVPIDTLTSTAATHLVQKPLMTHYGIYPNFACNTGGMAGLATGSTLPTVRLPEPGPCAAVAVAEEEMEPEPKAREELDEEDKNEITNLHQNLSVCIQQHIAAPAVPTTHKPAIWVTEYSDFSARYGLAYKLSCGHTGAAFNDGTKMVWDSEVGRVEYLARNRDKADGGRSARGQEERVLCTVDEYPEALKKKITLITYFKSYFSKYKGKNVTYPIVVANANSTETEKPKPSEPFVYVKQWMKHTHAVVFRLSNKCFQVSFFDGTDILLSSEAKLVTYTDQSGHSRTFVLELGKIPHKDVAERLEYTQQILYQIMHK